MDLRDYYAFPGDCTPPDFGNTPIDAIVPITTYSGEKIKDCIFGSAQYIVKPFTINGLRFHTSDELHMFVGTNHKAPTSLEGTIEFQLGNDLLNLTETCFVFVPEGVAHGNINITKMNQSFPILHYICHMTESFYNYHKTAKATEPQGIFADTIITRYAPVNNYQPATAPKGFLTQILYIDNDRLFGSPYQAASWFCSSNPSGPNEHVHDNFDELIGFLSDDPRHPEDLGGQIDFGINGQIVSCTKSVLFYLPRRVKHCPLLVPNCNANRRILHFSGSNKGNYFKRDKKGISDTFE